MRRERELVPRARAPWSWLGGILTLGLVLAGTAAAAMALWENVDIQRLTRLPGDVRAMTLPAPQSPAAPATPEPGFEAVIFRSEATAGFFPEGEFYPGVLKRWDTLLTEAGGNVRSVRSAEEIDALGGRGLLVAPSAVCLDTAEVGALQRHAESGGGLLITWATGARDGACEWLGWNALASLSGAHDVREVDARAALFLTIPSETSLSGGIEPGARIELRWDAQLAVATPGPRIYWSDWALNPQPADDTDLVDGAATVRRLEGGGRIVWFGFMEHHGAGELDEARLRRLLTNGIRWAAGVPTAEILPWPDGNRAAFVLGQAVSGEFASARLLAEMALDREIPATHFVVSQLARAHPNLAQLLRRSGEVSSQTSDNSLLLGLPAGEQETRLRRSVSEIREWTGSEPPGLRPPEEGADKATLEAWSALGGRYLVGLNEGRTGSPEVIRTEEGEIVLLPRMMKDDYNLLIQERVLRPADFAAELQSGMSKLHALGGLALLTVHSELAGTPRYLDPIGAMLETEFGKEGWWLATGGQVAEWTLSRRNATVQLRQADADRFEIHVQASEDRPLTGGWVGLNLPDGSAGWAPEDSSGPLGYRQSDRGIEIAIGTLEAGQIRTIVVRRLAIEEAP